MREEDVNSVLERLGRGQLHTLTARLGFDFQSRLTQDYINYLLEIEWNEERRGVLESFYIDQQVGKKSYDISLYILPPAGDFNDIKQNIRNNLVENIDVIFNSERDDGFQISQDTNNIMSGNYYFASDRIIPDIVRKSITKVRLMQLVNFEINNSENSVKIFNNLPSHYMKFQKTFRDTTNIELQIRGLHNHTNDSMQRVRNFLNNYRLRGTEEIILWFPQTLREHVHKITYDGQDIFNDEDVVHHIEHDHAIVIGFKLQLEYNGFNFRVKVGSNSRIGYVTVNSGGRYNEARDLAHDLLDNYRQYFL